jgi:hypothetical protein
MNNINIVISCEKVSRTAYDKIPPHIEEEFSTLTPYSKT